MEILAVAGKWKNSPRWPPIIPNRRRNSPSKRPARDDLSHSGKGTPTRPQLEMRLVRPLASEHTMKHSANSLIVLNATVSVLEIRQEAYSLLSSSG